MEGGTILTYTSREDQRETLHDGSWGVTLTGQPPPHHPTISESQAQSRGNAFLWSGPEGVARISFGIPQEIQLRHREGNVDTWRPIAGDPMIPDDTMDSSNQRLVDDLMSAIRWRRRAGGQRSARHEGTGDDRGGLRLGALRGEGRAAPRRPHPPARHDLLH